MTVGQLTPEFLATVAQLQRKGYGPRFIQLEPRLARAYRNREDWALDYVDAVWAEQPEGSGALELVATDGEYLGYWSG